MALQFLERYLVICLSDSEMWSLLTLKLLIYFTLKNRNSNVFSYTLYVASFNSLIRMTYDLRMTTLRGIVA